MYNRISSNSEKRLEGNHEENRRRITGHQCAADMDCMKTPSVRRPLESAGLRFVSDDRTTPEYLAKFVQSEIAKWAAPIEACGISVD